MHGPNGVPSSTLRLGRAAFYGLAGEIIRAIEPHTEANPAALLLQFLVAFGFIVGRSAFYVADGALHYPNLFTVIVGATAKSRKGTSWSRLRRDVFEVLSAWPRDRVMNGLSTGEGLIAQVGDAQHDKRLLVVQSEFGATLKVLERPGNTLSPVMRDAWDGADLRIMTRNSPIAATDEHVAIIGHITADELKAGIENVELWNGFANRFLWCAASRVRLLPCGSDPKASVMQPLRQELHDVMKWARRLKGREVVWSAAARVDWRTAYERLALVRRGLLGAVTCRAEAQVVRLALIYALLDKKTRISTDHLRAALSVWWYCEKSAENIFGASLGNGTAERILQLLRSNPNGLTRTEMMDLLGRHRTKSQLQNALSILEEERLAAKEQLKTAGRPIERWRVASSA